ncbi:uncharacterized protein LOC128740352 [Sabethes cyaneus]|uniref:uncharacterized protein LOC128740352 n=1 Tax=Sabethes cyaneus TaxID=53552 RepID=UPI00237EE76A|nr:uncharacterized protein LOC128740352 [Sabethes cyaneus]
MSNGYGPSSSKRSLMANVAMSMLRYVAPAWAPALDGKRNQACLNKVFKLMVLRVACAYRAISIGVIAAMIPICILVGEDIEWTHRLIHSTSSWIGRRHGENVCGAACVGAVDRAVMDVMTELQRLERLQRQDLT